VVSKIWTIGKALIVFQQGERLSNKRQQYKAEFKTKAALEATKGKRTISELSALCQIHPTLINTWKKSLVQGATGVCEKGKKQVAKQGPSEEELYKEIGKFKMEQDFLGYIRN